MSELRNQLKNVNDRADELANNPSELTKDALLAQLRSFYDVVKGLQWEDSPEVVLTPKAVAMTPPPAAVAEVEKAPAPEPIPETVAKKVAKVAVPETVTEEVKAPVAEEKVEAPVEAKAPEPVAAPIAEKQVELPAEEKAPGVPKAFVAEPVAEAPKVEEKPRAKKEPLIGKDEPVVAGGDKKILAGQFNNAPLTDLRSAIPLNEKFGIIRNLFKGNASDFGDAVLKLNNAASVKEVTHYMELLKQRFEWDERTESYQNFSGYVNRKILGLSPSNADSD